MVWRRTAKQLKHSTTVISYANSCYKDKNALLRPYWSNTSSNSIVRTLVEQADLSVKWEIESLIEGKTITKPIYEDITYDDMNSTQDNLWNFLFFTGYLKKISKQQDSKYDEALRQIEDQKYEEVLKQEGDTDILKYGIAFYRKECMVK